MAKQATFSASNGNTTLKLEFTFPTATMLKYATAWAKYGWNHGYGDHGTEEEPIEFTDLTNQQKIDLILERVFDLGKAEAKTQIHVDATFDPDAQADIDEIEAMNGGE